MPDWNASGTRIAFVRCRGGKLGNCDIFAMDADGANPSRLTSTPERAGDLAGLVARRRPDRIHLERPGLVPGHLGHGRQRIEPAPASPRPRRSMRSPSGRPTAQSIAFTSDRAAVDDIWVMDADGSNPVRLTSGPRADERPDWAPDGSRIVFSRNGNIWVMDADGQNETQLDRHEAGRVRPCVLTERAADRLQPARQRRPHRHLGDARRRIGPGAEDVRPASTSSQTGSRASGRRRPLAPTGRSHQMPWSFAHVVGEHSAADRLRIGDRQEVAIDERAEHPLERLAHQPRRHREHLGLRRLVRSRA